MNLQYFVHKPSPYKSLALLITLFCCYSPHSFCSDNTLLPELPDGIINCKDYKKHHNLEDLARNITPPDLIPDVPQPSPSTIATIMRAQKKYRIEGKQCPTCKNYYNNLKRHMIYHTKDRLYTCTKDSCTKTFVDKNGLQQHLKTHGQTRHACSNCPKTFSSSTNLRKHANIAHNPNHQRFACDHVSCSVSFKRSDDLLKHIRSVHKQKNESL